MNLCGGECIPPPRCYFTDNSPAEKSTHSESLLQIRLISLASYIQNFESIACCQSEVITILSRHTGMTPMK